jgi:hypothetical protein
MLSVEVEEEPKRGGWLSGGGQELPERGGKLPVLAGILSEWTRMLSGLGSKIPVREVK